MIVGTSYVIEMMPPNPDGERVYLCKSEFDQNVLGRVTKMTELERAGDGFIAYVPSRTAQRWVVRGQAVALPPEPGE
jgi:hypothetical protein